MRSSFLTSLGLYGLAAFPGFLSAETTSEPSDLFADWIILSGQLSVSDSGTYMRLHAGTPVTEIIRLLTLTAEDEHWPAVVKFSMRPIAEFGDPVASSLSVLGARVAFLAEEDGTAQVYLFDGEEPVASGLTFPIGENGEAVGWQQLLFHFAEGAAGDEAGKWRFSLGDSHYEPWLIRGPGILDGEGIVQIFGHKVEDVLLDGIEVVIQPEGDGDVSWEEVDDAASAANALPEEDLDNPESGSSSDLSATTNWPVGATSNSGSAPVIYMHPTQGDDSNDGMSAAPFGSSGPKKTLQAAMDAVSSGGCIVIATGVYPSPGSLKTHGKRIFIKTMGAARFSTRKP